MKNFSLITNVYKDPGLLFTRQIMEYIKEAGGCAELLVSFEGRCLEPDFGTQQIPQGTECILVLGGDGTLIRVATRLEHLNIPLVGVNLGHLGYLCEVERATVFRALDRIMQGRYTLENRMMLSGRESSGTEGVSALNDIVIHQVETLSILNLNVYVNGEFLSAYHADGMIIATPTGATAYNLSAGGPIVDPKARMIILTPINAHNLNSRSIVLSDDAVVDIELASRRQGVEERAAVSFDGDLRMELRPGDRIRIRASKEVTQILRLNKESFLEIMRRKMENND